MSNSPIRLIKEIHDEAHLTGKPVISFEFFPPKTEAGTETFFSTTLPALFAAKPDFCSVTYGAGGGTKEATLGIVERIQR